jgi:methionyl-tRNA formyltransferase
MKRVKIGYFADGPWSHKAFDKIISDTRFQVQFICVRYDTNDQILVSIAKTHNIMLLKHPNVNSIEFLDSIAKYSCDIFVSMSFNQILKSNFINYPPLKTINCHAGKLPFYRGRNVLNWVLINDEKEFGITVHYIDEGIDTGDIILQKVFPITDQDDYSSLLELAYTECANILYESLVMIYDGNVNPVHQKDIHPVGFYCTQRKEGDEIINWNNKSREIFNFVRALCKPGPGAVTSIRGKSLIINRIKIINDAPQYCGIAGSVVGKKSNSEIIIKTGDSTIELVEYDYDGKIRIGDRLE